MPTHPRGKPQGRHRHPAGGQREPALGAHGAHQREVAAPVHGPRFDQFGPRAAARHASGPSRDARRIRRGTPVAVGLPWRPTAGRRRARRGRTLDPVTRAVIAHSGPPTAGRGAMHQRRAELLPCSKRLASDRAHAPGSGDPKSPDRLRLHTSSAENQARSRPESSTVGRHRMRGRIPGDRHCRRPPLA
jgi:hypothetical protein